MDSENEGLHETLLEHRYVIVRTEDDVVEKRNFHNFACFEQMLGRGNIFVRRIAVRRRMIVADNYTRSVIEKRSLKYGADPYDSVRQIAMAPRLSVVSVVVFRHSR